MEIYIDLSISHFSTSKCTLMILCKAYVELMQTSRGSGVAKARSCLGCPRTTADLNKSFPTLVLLESPRYDFNLDLETLF